MKPIFRYEHYRPTLPRIVGEAVRRKALDLGELAWAPLVADMLSADPEVQRHVRLIQEEIAEREGSR